jgi:hypothetical protein
MLDTMLARRRWAGGVALALAVALAGCGDEPGPESPGGRDGAAAMTLTSTTFTEGGEIPATHACPRLGGDGASPELTFAGVPDEADSLALIVLDPDADNYVHWVVVEIPVTTTGAPAGLPPEGGLVRTSYVPMCPPDGTHSYVWTLYALGAGFDGATGGTDEVIAAVEAAALARGELTATFTAP